VPTLRVVLDTNVLVSGIAYTASIPGRIVEAWKRGAIEVVLSRHIIEELSRVLPRLNHRLNWRPADFADQIDLLVIQADLVEPDPAEDGKSKVIFEFFGAGESTVIGKFGKRSVWGRYRPNGHCQAASRTTPWFGCCRSTAC